MKNKLLSLHSPPVFRTAGTGETFCEEDPTSNACHAIKRRWADELNLFVTQPSSAQESINCSKNDVQKNNQQN